ncbi:helix-turn-helix transcriptional regulator [Nocardia wallacei]|uniref:helix-turn-helix transcriptional regulator n=1 Tax=Nocardia wallacei TaxID=480035 RepID=UPI0024554E35|nr:AraC family transcriptional regulator [Nocardia wallacei]
MTTMSAAPTDRATRTVWLWAGHAAYLGPSFHLDTHSTPVHCFALGVDGPFTVTTPDGGARRRRSVLVPARTTHRIEAGDGRMLFFYVDPRSVHADRLRSAMTDTSEAIAAHHRAEDDLLAELHRHADLDELHRLLLGGGAAEIDPRIRRAMTAIIEDPSGDLGADELAAAAGLSTSRFLHLFAAGAGTSLRRYRLWARMLSVAASIAAGHDLTRAATDAGFASPSHFSDTFRTLFGLTATTLLSQGTTIVTRP